MPTWATSARGRSASPGSAWCCPALALNYMGQGALLMREPAALENPFFRMFPRGLADSGGAARTLAAVIASQAVISGAYSMTRQAIQLGFLPRMRVALHLGQRGRADLHAAGELGAAGRPCCVAVVGFGSSTALAAAYGIAVTVTMLITTLLTFFVVRHGWGYPLPVALGRHRRLPRARRAAGGLLLRSSSSRAAGSRWSLARRCSR